MAEHAEDVQDFGHKLLQKNRSDQLKTHFRGCLGDWTCRPIIEPRRTTMSMDFSLPTRCDLLATTAAAGALGLAASAAVPGAAAEDNAIRSLRINVPEEALVDLRRRINATNWSERETVTDASQGVQLATIQELARHWATDYDWRKCERN
jgi:hypothetical protein